MHTGQYNNYHGQTPRKLKTSWITALYLYQINIYSNKQ